MRRRSKDSHSLLVIRSRLGNSSGGLYQDLPYDYPTIAREFPEDQWIKGVKEYIFFCAFVLQHGSRMYQRTDCKMQVWHAHAADREGRWLEAFWRWKDIPWWCCYHRTVCEYLRSLNTKTLSLFSALKFQCRQSLVAQTVNLLFACLEGQ